MTVAGFPANLDVQWETWSAGPENELDEVTDVWAVPAPRKVISWSSDRTVTRDGAHVALDLDKVSLQIPAEGFDWGTRDRVTIPGRGTYLVAGIEDGVGFHGWRPGLSLHLEKS